MPSPLFCSPRTAAPSTACTTWRRWWCITVPGECQPAGVRGIAGQTCGFIPNSLKNGFLYMKVVEENCLQFWCERIFLSGCEAGRHMKAKWSAFIWTQCSEPSLWSTKSCSLYSKVISFASWQQMGRNGKLFITYFMSSTLKIHFLFCWIILDFSALKVCIRGIYLLISGLFEND